jgi:hypothetical protein
MKEEYSRIRQLATGVVENDIAPALSKLEVSKFVETLELAVRVGNELVLPELMDLGQRTFSVAVIGEEQAKALNRLIATFKKHGEFAEVKVQNLYTRALQHLDHMEKAVLPLVRDVISTPVREDIGEIALDYRTELSTSKDSVEKSRDSGTSATISA